jgi:hypothetical protein
MAGSIDPLKAAIVADFLKDEFPGHHVYDQEDFATDCQFYRIDQGGTGSVAHRVRVSREFLDDNSADRILHRLKAWQLRDVLRRAGARAILVTNAGCEIVGE